MNRKILFDADARSAMKDGIDEVASAVKVTLGAKGRNVVIKDKGKLTRVTKDGVSCSDSIYFDDGLKAAGAELIKEAASNANKESGDGTSTCTILTQAICDGGFNAINHKPNIFKRMFFKNRLVNSIDVKRGIDKATEVVVDHLKSISVPIGYDNEKIKQVAKISSNNDEEIASLISDAMKEIGEDGVVVVEDSKSTNTYVELTEGLRFDRGYLSPYFINDKDGTSMYENAKVFITDRTLSTMKDIEPLGSVLQSHPLLIIAENVEGEALNTLILNRVQRNMRMCIIRAPGLGETKVELLKDIAVVVGGELVSDSVGINMENFTHDMLGDCDKFTVSNVSTTILGGKGDAKEIEKRIDLLKKEKENEERKEHALVLRDRIARLVNGIAILYIGGFSEVEISEKSDRVIDALSATRAAIEEGVLVGGGMAYVRSIDNLNKLIVDNDDEHIGVNIIKRAIEEPFRQIIHNAGLNSSVVLNKVLGYGDNYGYNVRTDKYEDLVGSGVIDPAKVARVALENAASVAGMFLTAECIIVDEEKK